MELNLIDIISLFIAFISILFALFLLSIKSKNYLSNVLIAIFLFTYAQDSAAQFVSYFIFPNYPGLYLLITITIFLKLPALYFYILSTIYSDFKLKKKDLWHMLPFFIVLIIFIPNYFSVDYNAKNAFWEESNNATRWEISFNYIFLHIQILVYFIASYLAVYKYKHLLLENYSNANKFNYRWMLRLISIYAIIAVLEGTRHLFMFMNIDFLSRYALLLFVQMIIILHNQN